MRRDGIRRQPHRRNGAYPTRSVPGAIAVPVVALVLAVVFSGCATLSRRDFPAHPIGVGIDASDSLPFVDAAKTLRPFQTPDGETLPSELLDEHGWPLVDARTVLFDRRPIFAWAPPIDDPQAYQQDVSGAYTLRFRGQAEVVNGRDDAGPQAEIGPLTWDPATNTTSGPVLLPPGRGLLILEFRATRRTPDAPPGSGITDLELIRPGYDPDDYPTFNPALVAALEPFSTVRYMDFLHTNNRDVGWPVQLSWSHRKLPGDATQAPWGEKRGGAAWEYVIELANLTRTDPWITVPVDASDEYVEELARLFAERLDPALTVYVEHSNEVWNALFSQHEWNAAAAVDEVRSNPDSALDWNRPFDPVLWEVRRHMRRTVEIGAAFSAAFAGASSPDVSARRHPRVRPIFSWWINRQVEYLDALEWLRANVGEPSELLWGIGITAYFSSAGASPDATEEEILTVMEREVDEGIRRFADYATLADEWNLKLAVYEGGSDTGQNASGPVASRIAAERDPSVGELLRRSITGFLDAGGDLYMNFSLVSRYSRFGSWGLTDDIFIPERNAKYPTVVDLVEARGRTR